VPKPGVTSAESLQYGSTNAYMAENEAFESLYAVGSVVVNEWVSGWGRYGVTSPGTP
jgi:purine nucleoside permease